MLLVSAVNKTFSSCFEKFEREREGGPALELVHDVLN